MGDAGHARKKEFDHLHHWAWALCWHHLHNQDQVNCFFLLFFYSCFMESYYLSSIFSNQKVLVDISKQAADVVLLLQLNRTLRLDLLHGSAWLHSSTRRWRETHSRSSWTQSQFLSPFTKYSFWSTFSGKISHSPERLDLPDLFENISLVSVRHVS